MENLGYYNGKFGPLNEMSIPMNDRVHWFGDGVYDAGPARNYKIFAIDEHIDRFFNSAELLEIEMPCTKQELKDLLNKLVKKVDTGSQFVYYQVTRGTGIRDHAFTEGPGNLWVMLKPAAISDGIEPIKLITEPDTRFFHCNIKTLNLIPSVMASEKAKRAGCQAVSYTHLKVGRMATPDYYKTLGVPRDADADAIKKAFRKLARKHHPDAGGDEAKFKEINEAYELSLIHISGTEHSSSTSASRTKSRTTSLRFLARPRRATR